MDSKEKYLMILLFFFFIGKDFATWVKDPTIYPLTDTSTSFQRLYYKETKEK